MGINVLESLEMLLLVPQHLINTQSLINPISQLFSYLHYGKRSIVIRNSYQ